MINFKEWNVKELGNYAVLGIVLILVVSVFMTFINPLLVTILPTIFTHTLTITDVLLLLILMRLHVK
jgi:hypothetical protein